MAQPGYSTAGVGRTGTKLVGLLTSSTALSSAPADDGAACVAGDESSVSVPGCTYIAGQYSIPGTGTLEIASLAGDQQAQTTGTGGKKLLLKGSSFTARFSVMAPAMQPPPGPGSPIPDPTPSYSGSGSFVAVDATVKAS